MKVVCIIPARLASQRFPKKVLVRLGGKPLLQWVWEAALATKRFDVVAFAIDAPATARVINSFGGKYYFTSPNCLSGTDRLIELCSKDTLCGDIWVNWQGDEPFICPDMIETLLQSAHLDGSIWSLKKKIEAKETIQDPNVVKVVTSDQGRALYFSRAPIPYDRERENRTIYYKHIGIYAFTNQSLKEMSTLPHSRLEEIEKLEPLRFLEHGFKMQLHETLHETIGIDVPEDLNRALERIALESAAR